MLWPVVVSMLVLVFAAAVLHDRKEKRRGSRLRSGREITGESMHHRVDIDAVPYEPARHAGQRDWATYRRRDRKRPSR